MNVLWEHRVLFLEGLKTTVALTSLSFAAAFAIGLVAASMRISPVRPLRTASAAYVTMVRNSPLAVLMYLFVFGFTKVGLRYSEFNSAVIVLSAYTGTYVAETIRAGINAVPAGQTEAARALGLGFGRALTLIILPQALRTMIGPLGSVLIALIKNSSLASLIAVVDLTGAADRVNTLIADPLAAFGAAALAYVLLAVPTGWAVSGLQRRLAIRR